MLSVLNDFKIKVQEINLYFELIKDIDNNAMLARPYDYQEGYRLLNINNDLKKVLKANTFLLLYNLAESSIRQALVTVHDAITTKSITYDQVIDEIRQVWINIKYENFKNYGTEFIFQKIHNIGSDIIDMEFKDKISGNIDARKIREYALLYGFKAKTHKKCHNGKELLSVKKNRNDLAHGNKSFAECGRDYTFADLEKIKKEVIWHLRGVLSNIDQYIKNDIFLR